MRHVVIVLELNLLPWTGVAQSISHMFMWKTVEIRENVCPGKGSGRNLFLFNKVCCGIENSKRTDVQQVRTMKKQVEMMAFSS